MIQGTRCLINEVGSGRIFVYAYGLFVTVIADSESYVQRRVLVYVFNSLCRNRGVSCIARRNRVYYFTEAIIVCCIWTKSHQLKLVDSYADQQ